jgi:hypothetical protein
VDAPRQGIGPTAQAAPNAGTADIRSGLRAVLATYLGARALAAVAIVAGHLREPERSWAKLVSPWDGGNYLSVMTDGYAASLPGIDPVDGPPTAAFFPLFPLLVRGGAEVTGAPLVWTGIALNHLLGGLAASLGFLLARRYLPTPAAVRAGILFAVLPGAGVISLLYAEALLLALAAGSLLALSSRRWMLAGLLGMLATATRPTGVALVFAAGAFSILAIRERQEWRSLWAPALAPFGAVAYFGYLWWHTGHVFAWFELERLHWHQELDFGWGFTRPLGDPDLMLRPERPAMLLGFVLIGLAAWLVWKRGLRLPTGLAVFTLAALAQMLLFSAVGPRPRLLLLAFPLTWLFAHWLTGRRFVAFAVVSAGLMTLITYLFVIEWLLP